MQSIPNKKTGSGIITGVEALSEEERQVQKNKETHSQRDFRCTKNNVSPDLENNSLILLIVTELNKYLNNLLSSE